MRDPIYHSCLYIDRYAAAENARALASHFGKCGIIPVLKGDAFGLGLLPMAKCITDAIRIPFLAVAHLSEGIELRSGGIRQPILIFAGALPSQCEAAVRNDLTLAVGRTGLIPRLAQEARRQQKTAGIHIAIDTGLHRLGVQPGEELGALLREALQNRDAVRVTGTYSHFADAETIGSERARIQRDLYLGALRQVRRAGIEPGLRHMSNSAASEWFPNANFDAVRLGRRLFFDSPTAPTGIVKEVASWRAYLTCVRPLAAGERFGYGEGHTLDRDGRIAMIGVGYADGLRHDLVRAHAPVLVRGKRAPLLDLCMDQAYIDVTDIPCEIGDETTLFGADETGRNVLPAQEVAAYANDEGCGLTAMLLPRVKRIYL